MDLEHIPRSLVNILHFTKQFQSQQTKHLPQFSSIKRHGMSVSMSLHVAEVSLRSIIGNRPLMEIKGGAIAVLLIEGLTEIEQQQVCLRSINPSSVTISNDLKRLIFRDTHNICIQGSEEPAQDSGAAPYSNYEYFEKLDISRSDAHHDTWAVGVVLLEIIVGSEFVLIAKNQEKVMWLLLHLEAHIDKVLFDMLEELLDYGCFGKATDLLNSN